METNSLTMQKEKIMATNGNKRAFGIFTNHQQAEQALTQLNETGFAMKNVSVIAKQVDDDEHLGGAETSDRVGSQHVKTSTGVVQETLQYGIWGTTLVGLTGLAIPGIGPIIAAGSLGAALVAMTGSTGVSALAMNNLTKALVDFGIPEDQATGFRDRLLQGNYLVTVEGTDANISRAEKIFREQGIQNWTICDAATIASD